MGGGDGGDGGGTHSPVHSRSATFAVVAGAVAPVVVVGAIVAAAADAAVAVGSVDEQDAMADGAAERVDGPSYCSRSTGLLHDED